MSVEKQLACVISGSFDKAKPEIDKAIDEFTELGVNVKAPGKGWLYLPAERRKLTFRPLPSEIGKTIKEIEDDYINDLNRSDFVYVVNPNGYIGDVVAFEIGIAVAGKIPVYSKEPISRLLDEGTLQDVIPSIKVLNPKEALSDMLNPID